MFKVIEHVSTVKMLITLFA